MSERAPQQIAAEFAAWAVANHPGIEVEPDVVETILGLKENHFAPAKPGSWRLGEMTEILTDLIPRKVVADQDWNDALVRTTPLFVDFLAEEKQLRAARRLRAEVEFALPRFVAAVNDPGNWSMGKRVLSAMGAEGIPDQDELDALTAQFNALPFEERGRILDALPAAGPPAESPEPLPAVRLAPVAELVGAARSAPMIADVLSLVRWLGDRREVTATGALRVKDGRQAALDLGLIDPAALASRELMWPIRSSAELRNLDELWTWAVESGFIRLTATRAYPGPAVTDWQDGDDEEALTAWGEVFNAVLAGLVEGYQAVMTYQADVHASFPAMLFTAYIEGEISRARVIETHAEQIAGHRIFALPDFDPKTEVAEALDGGLSRLERLGAVATDGDSIRLTPLGTWKLNTLYLSFGWIAPSVGDLRDADTVTRLAGLAQLSETDAETEIAAWLDDADHAALAVEVVDAIGAAEPVIRTTAFDLLGRIGEPAAPAMDRLVDTPWWRYGAAWYEQQGRSGPRPLSGPDRAWLLAEMVAPALDDLGGDVEGLRDVLAVEPGTDVTRLYEDLRHSGHPRAADALEALAAIAPDKATAKAARKAAYRTRSR